MSKIMGKEEIPKNEKNKKKYPFQKPQNTLLFLSRICIN